MHYFLVFYYDGNDNKAAIVPSVGREIVPHHIADTAQARDWDVLMVLELHHDYFDADPIDWSPSLVIDGIQLNVNALPHFGIP